jgi:parvulin-like peptidyl-prolyl isomerase
MFISTSVTPHRYRSAYANMDYGFRGGSVNTQRALIISSIVWWISSPCASAQKAGSLPQDTIARVGTAVITARELKLRLELMPFPDTQKGMNIDTLKARALRAMIAEKALAHEKRVRGLPEDRSTELMRYELENVLVRDELYRREVVAKSRPTPEEIAVGMNRYVYVSKVLSFLVRDEEDGITLARMLKNRRPDSLVQVIPNALYYQCDTLTIRFGAPDTAFENAAYAIGKSRVSKPFRSAMFDWAVLYLLDKGQNPEAMEKNLADRHRRVEKTLQARHEGERYEQYYRQTLISRNALADSALFTLLADSIVALWKEDTSHFQSHGAYILTGDVVDLLITRLRPFLDSVFVSIDDGNLTLGQVLEMFRYLDFRSKALEGLAFKLELNEAVKGVVAREILVREGRKQGLQYLADVQEDLRLWDDFWAARQLYYIVRDSVAVTDDDVVRHLLKNKEIFGRAYEVNVREVLTDSLREMAAILDQLERGRSLADLAREFSRRTEWAPNGGESKFFRVLQHPELGFEALMADTGKLTGPVGLPEGSSLFIVLGKRRTKDATVGFDTLSQNIRMRLLGEKRKQTVDRYIANLVREQQVSIDEEKLRNVRINQVPMFTRRFIGFGGKMAAAPLLMKQWDWVKESQVPGTIVP